jgi:hypothetical protein
MSSEEEAEEASLKEEREARLSHAMLEYFRGNPEPLIQLLDEGFRRSQALTKVLLIEMGLILDDPTDIDDWDDL